MHGSSSPCRTPVLLQTTAFMFGSVPLKTYLPDGDIDVSVFCTPDTAQALKDMWTTRLQKVIEGEQQNGNAPYEISDITVINAEVGSSGGDDMPPPPAASGKHTTTTTGTAPKRSPAQCMQQAHK
jgi:hypothetical protein